MRGFFSFQRVISLIVVVCFLTTNAIAAPEQGTFLGTRTSGPDQTETDIFSRKIPSEFGSVVETYDASKARARKTRSPNEFRAPSPESRFVIYIQDAHDSLEAQENIAAMVRYFVKEYGARTVYEEGYEGPVPTDELFSAIHDPALKEKISYYLMDKLRVGGAEYAHINRRTAGDSHLVSRDSQNKKSEQVPSPESRGTDFDLIGADSIALHLENVRAYEQSAKKRGDVTQDIQRIRKELQKLIDRNFPKEFKEWLKLKERYQSGKLPLVDYLKRTYPLRGTGNVERETQDENKNGKSFPVSRSSFLGVEALLSGNEAGIKKINPLQLLQEIQQMEDEIVRAGLPEARDQKTYGYFQSVLLLEKLNALQLSAEEYIVLKDSLESLKTEDVACFIARESHRSIVLFRSWEDLIADSINFYELAKRRDHSISKVFDDSISADREHGLGTRDSSLAKTSPESREASPSPAVLVFGGFHKEAIKKTLKEKGIGYVILSPSIGAPSKRHEDYYRMLMSGGRYEFEKNQGLGTRDSSLVKTSFKSRDASPEERVKNVARESTCPERTAAFANASAIVSHLGEVGTPFRSETRENFILKVDRAIDVEAKAGQISTPEFQGSVLNETRVKLDGNLRLVIPADWTAWRSKERKEVVLVVGTEPDTFDIRTPEALDQLSRDKMIEMAKTLPGRRQLRSRGATRFPREISAQGRIHADLAKFFKEQLAGLQPGAEVLLQDHGGHITVTAVGPLNPNRSEVRGGTRWGGDNLSDLWPRLLELLAERKKVADTNLFWKPAIVVFGSARIPREHSYYHKATDLGRAIWEYGFVPRTGAGPSMMEAVFEGYLEARRASGAEPTPDNQTQGIKIELPYESSTNDDTEQVEFYDRFITRKLALHENIYGAIAVPGGFGTMDEVFEVWRRGRPLVLLGKDFWGPIITQLYESWEKAGLTARVDRRLTKPYITDDARQAVQYLKTYSNGQVYKTDHHDTPYVMKDLRQNLIRLQKMTRAVTFVGRPAEGSKELEIAEQLANRLGRRSGIPVRIASRNVLFDRIFENATDNQWLDLLQAVFFFSSRRPTILPREESLGKRIIMTGDESNHQVLTTHNSHAFVFLPGGVGTMNKLFDIVQIVQTDKTLRQPILLVGRSFWQPVKDALLRSMVPKDGGLSLISPQDSGIIRVVDSVDEAWEELNGHEPIRVGSIKNAVAIAQDLFHRAHVFSERDISAIRIESEKKQIAEVIPLPDKEVLNFENDAEFGNWAGTQLKRKGFETPADMHLEQKNDSLEMVFSELARSETRERFDDSEDEEGKELFIKIPKKQRKRSRSASEEEKMRPGDGGAKLLERAKSYHKQKDYESAVILLKRVVKSNPGKIMAYVFLVDSLLNLGRMKECLALGVTALALIKKSIEKGHPRWIDFSTGVSGVMFHAYLHEEDLSKAIQVVTQAVEQDPENPDALRHLAQGYMELANRGQDPDARRYLYERALKTADKAIECAKALQDKKHYQAIVEKVGKIKKDVVARLDAMKRSKGEAPLSEGQAVREGLIKQDPSLIKNADELAHYIQKLVSDINATAPAGQEALLTAIIREPQKYEKDFYKPLYKLFLKRISVDFDGAKDFVAYGGNIFSSKGVKGLREMMEQPDAPSNAALGYFRKIKPGKNTSEASVEFYGQILFFLTGQIGSYLGPVYDAIMATRPGIAIGRKGGSYHHRAESTIRLRDKGILYGTEKASSKYQEVRDGSFDSTTVNMNGRRDGAHALKIAKAIACWKEQAEKSGSQVLKERIENFEASAVVVEFDLDLPLIIADTERNVGRVLHVERLTHAFNFSATYLESLNIDNPQDMKELVVWLNIGQEWSDIYRDIVGDLPGNVVSDEISNIVEETRTQINLHFFGIEDSGLIPVEAQRERWPAGTTELTLERRLAIRMKEHVLKRYQKFQISVIEEEEKAEKFFAEGLKLQARDPQALAAAAERLDAREPFAAAHTFYRSLLNRYEAMGMYERARKIFNKFVYTTAAVQLYDVGGLMPYQFGMELIFTALRLGYWDDFINELEIAWTGRPDPERGIREEILQGKMRRGYPRKLTTINVGEAKFFLSQTWFSTKLKSAMKAQLLAMPLDLIEERERSAERVNRLLATPPLSVLKPEDIDPDFFSADETPRSEIRLSSVNDKSENQAGAMRAEMRQKAGELKEEDPEIGQAIREAVRKEAGKLPFYRLDANAYLQGRAALKYPASEISGKLEPGSFFRPLFSNGKAQPSRSEVRQPLGRPGILPDSLKRADNLDEKQSSDLAGDIEKELHLQWLQKEWTWKPFHSTASFGDRLYLSEGYSADGSEHYDFMRLHNLFFMDAKLYARLSLVLRERLGGNVIVIPDFRNNVLAATDEDKVGLKFYTAAMILAMLNTDLEGARFVDAGAGDGILSLVAAKLGAAELVLIEKEASELAKARESLKQNGLRSGKDFILVQGSLEEPAEILRQITPSTRPTVMAVNIGRWTKNYGTTTNESALRLIPGLERSSEKVTKVILGGYALSLAKSENSEFGAHGPESDIAFLKKSGFAVQPERARSLGAVSLIAKRPRSEVRDISSAAAEKRDSLLNHPKVGAAIRGDIQRWIAKEKRTLADEFVKKINKKYESLWSPSGRRNYWSLSSFELKQFLKAEHSLNASYYDDAAEVGFYLEQRSFYGLSNAPKILKEENPGLYQAARREGWRAEDFQKMRSEMREKKADPSVKLEEQMDHLLSREFLEKHSQAIGEMRGKIGLDLRAYSRDDDATSIASVGRGAVDILGKLSALTLRRMQEIPTLKKRQGDIKSPIATFVVHLGKSNVEWIMAGRYDEKGKEYRHSDLLQAFGLSEIAPKLVYGTINGAGPHDPEGSISLLFFDEKYPEENAVVLAMRLAAGGVPATKKVSVMIDQGLVASIHRLSDILPKTENARAKARNKETPTPNTSVLRQKLIKEPATDDAQDPTSSRSEMRGELIVSRDSGLGAGIENESLGTRDEVHAEVRSEARLVPSPAIINRQEIRRVQTVFQEQLRSLLSSPEKISALTPDEIAIGQYSFQLTWDRLSGEWVIKLADFGTAAKAALATNDFGELGALRIDGSNRDDVLLVKQLTKILAVGQQIAAEDPRLTKDPARLAQAFQKIVISLRDHTASGVSPPTQQKQAVAKPSAQGITLDEALGFYARLRRMDQDGLAAQKQLERMSPNERLKLTAQMALGISREPTKEELEAFTGSTIGVRKVSEFPALDTRLKQLNLKDHYAGYVEIDEKALAFLRRAPGGFSKTGKGCMNDAGKYGPLHLNGHETNYFRELGSYVYLKNQFQDAFHESFHHRAGGKAGHPFVQRTSVDDMNGLEEMQAYLGMNLRADGSIDENFPFGSIDQVEGYIDEKNHAKRSEACEFVKVVRRLIQIFPGRDVIHEVGRARSFAKIIEMGRLSDQDLVDLIRPGFTVEELALARQAGYDSRQKAVVELHQEALDRDYLRHLADPTAKKIQDWATQWAEPRVRYLVEMAGRSELWLVIEWLDSQDEHLTLAVAGALGVFGLSAQIIRDRVKALESGANEGQQIRNAVRNAGKGDSHLLGDSQRSEIRAEAKREIKEGKGSVPAGQQVSPERVLMQKKLEASDRIFTEVAQRRTVARKPVQGIAGPVSFETDKGVFKSTDSAYLPLIHLAMQIPQDGSATVLELGSGVGQFAIPFVLLNPRIKKFTGIEYDPVLVEESQEAASLASGDLPGVGLKGFFPEGKVAFKKGDFLAPEFGEDFREADLILYYRFGSSFEFPIEERIAEEAKVGAQFLTYTEHTDQPFAMLPHHPDFQMRILRDGTGKVATVFTRTAKTIGAIAPRESAIGAAIRNIAVRKSPGPMRSEAREETGAAFQVPGVDADDLAVKQAEYIRAITVLLQRHFLIEEIAEAHLEKYTWNLMPVSVDDLFRDEPELNKVLVRYEQIKNAKIFDFFTEWDVDLVYDMDSYAALSKETLPPVIVEQTESGAWKAFDGARRLLAAKLRGDSHINAFVGRLSSSPRTDSARSEMRDKEQRISGVSAIAHAAPPNTEKTLVHSVFEGGGAKGVAYVGALEELESRNMWFKEVAGTSAGAITAALIAAGYTYPEIKKIVFETDFDQFKDRRWGIVPPFLNFMILGGMYRGQVFEEWMSEKLKAKLGVEPRLKDLPIPLTVIASDITNKTMLVLDRDSAPDLKVAEAVRMSMGIPFFFEVYRWKGVYQRFPSAVRRVVDGGLLSNFPLSVYDEAGRRGEPVVGFMLQELPHSKKALSGLVGILVSLLKCFPPLHIAIASIETMQEGNDKRHIKLDVWARIVNIPVDIGTLDFNLTLAKKLEMAARGKEATKKILGLALRGEKGKAVLPKAGQIVKLSGKDSRVYFKPAGFNYGARFDTLDFYRDRDGALQANIRFRPDAKILIQPLAMWEASLGQLKPNGAQWDDAALAEASKSHRKEEFVSFNTEAARRFVLFDLRTRQEAVVDIIELAVDPEQAEKPVLVLNFANDATVKKNRGVVEIVPNSETVSATVAMAGTKPGATRSEMRDSVVKLADVQPKVERKLPVPASDEVVRKAYTALHGAREGEWVSPSGVSYAHRLSNLTEEDDFGKTRVLLEWWLDQVKRVFEKARQAQPTLTKEKFSILELGAADGYLARGLAKKGYSVTGMDFVKTFVKIANQANPYPKTLRFVRGDATNLDGYGDFAGVADASFDLVISNEWLGNVPIFEAQAKAKGKTEKRQVRPVFHEIFQKLKPGGVYILNDYLEKTNRSGITETMRDPLFWWIHYSVADRIRALQEAGFKNVLDAGKVPNGFSKREDDFTHAIIATKPFARSTALETRATSRQARAEMRDREQPIPEAASGTIQEAEKMMRVPWDQWPSKLKAAIQKHGVSPDFAALTRQVTSQKAMNIFSDFYLSGFPRQILDDPEQWAEFIRLAQVYAKPSVEFGEDAPENLEKMIRVLADFQSFGIDLNFLDEIAQHTKSYNRPFVLSMFLKPGPMAGVPFAMDVYEEKIRGASGASYEEFNRFLVFLIAEFSQFSVRIVDGLFEGLDEGIINARLDGAERERIVEFIRLTNGFCLELFRFYKKEGREAVVNLRRRYVGAILRDEIGVKEIKAFQAEMAALGYDGLKIVPAIFQIALPTTGATTLTHHEIQEIFERHLTAGDMRSTLPSQFRHADLLNGKGEIFLKEKVLAPGQAWTEDLEKVLTRVRASSAQENEAEFIAMVLKKEYTAQPARFLGLLLGLAPEPLRITSVEALKDFSGNELLREGFLSDGEYAKFLSDWADEHAELLLQSEPQAFAKTSVAKVLPRVVAIWEQRSFDRSERLGKLLKNISPQDLSGLIGMVEGREDLKGYLKAFLAEQKPSDKVIRDAVSAMTQSVQDLLGKAPFVSQRIPLEMRMVRGPAHALWGANCGTCIGTDWELWKNKSFGLISITDTLNQQVVGYIHLYSTQVNGRKALIVPGIEPRVEFIQQTQGKDFYRLVEKAFDRLISAGDWDVLYLPEYEHAISGRFDIRNEVLAKGYPVVQVSGGVISWSTDPKYHLKSLYLVRQKSENRSGVRVAKDQPKQLEAGKILEFKPASQFTKGELFEKGVAAVVAEAQEKMGFWRRWLPEAWSGRGADALVVFRGGAAMGVWACGELAAGFIQDNGLYISSKARGVGLGKVLRRAMITFLKNSGHEWFRIGAPESYNWISEDPGVQKFHEGMAAWIGVTARRDIHRRLKHLLVHLPSVPAETGVNLYREISGKSLGAGDIHLPAPSAKQDSSVKIGSKAVETKAEQATKPRSLAPTSVRPELKQNVRRVIENLRGKFTIMTDMADAVNFTDAQLREFEAMAVLQANVRFVFYGDGAKFSSGTGAKKHLEQLQRELGADRILITEAGVRDVFLNKGEKVIHISKTSAENRVASVEADLLRRTDKMFSFRYLGEETGLVAMALLYADQHEKPSPKGTMDLSMVNAMLRADLQEFQNSIVFARAA